MAHLYHTTCYFSPWRRLYRWLLGMREPMPRFRYVTGPNPPGVVPVTEVDRLACTQTFRCDGCGSEIHVDTDWQDLAGGFIGSAVEDNPFRKTQKEANRADAL